MRLIDADAMKENLIKAFDDKVCDAGFFPDLTRKLLKMFADEQPTIDPVKHGKWEPYMFGDERWHVCSVCGIADQYGMKYEDFNGKEHLVLSVRNYCPYCGARMDL